MDKLTVATISFCSTNDKTANLSKAFSLIQRAKDFNADWVVLPEIFSFHGPYQQLHEAAEFDGSPLLSQLSGIAMDLNITLFAGSVGERSSEAETQMNENGHKKVFNSSYVFSSVGKQIAKYRKTHLFNLIGEDGTPSYCESDGFIPGQELSVINIDGWRIGLAICYDLRFGEFFAKLAENGPLDAIVIPSAFTESTGKDHWEVLLRARGIEQQCYILAANQCGEHRPGVRSYGHSMIIDPWGQKLADTGDVEGLAIAEISKSRIKEVRKRLPALLNKRPDLY